MAAVPIQKNRSFEFFAIKHEGEQPATVSGFVSRIGGGLLSKTKNTVRTVSGAHIKECYVSALTSSTISDVFARQYRHSNRARVWFQRSATMAISQAVN
jgi:hypothetical protein